MRAEIKRLNEVIDKIVESYPMGGDGSPVYMSGNEYHVATGYDWNQVEVFDTKHDAVLFDAGVMLRPDITSKR